MAFLVCRKRSGVEFSWKDRLIYLDQEFYELIFYLPAGKESILRRISRLSYGEEMEIGNTELHKLKEELMVLADDVSNDQANNFGKVVNDSLESNCTLMISGDMYPTLSTC